MAGALLCGNLTFLIGVVLGGPFVRLLRRRGIGKRIRLDGPSRHDVKMGTPTMGGLMFLVPIVGVSLLTNVVGRLSMLLPLGVMAAFAMLGAYDDWRGLQDRTGVGMLARVKFPWQMLIGVAAAIGLRQLLGLGGTAVPTVRVSLDIGWLYVPVAALLIVGFANAVNLSDGLDSLAGGTGAVAYCAYGVIAYLQGQTYLSVFCFTVVGGLLAFLWYNAHPAELFMGDVGSMPLGATLAVVALMTEQWLLLGVVGIVFVAEALSVMLQVGYFKVTGGKRLFKMAPLHHHFELLGWSEVQTVQRFWLVSMLSAMVGVALALL
jgi:phospho-N-acetylmuramoyl-pentapeptide-transferase